MSVFHVRHGEMYHTENSLRGIRRAARARNPDGTRKYDEIDLDLLISKDNRIVGCHWPRPIRRDGFRDPKKQLAPSRTVASMTLLELARLKAAHWPRVYRIQTVERLLAECARVGIGAVLEPKSPDFTLAHWQHIGKVADAVGVHVRVYALPQNSAALDPARRAGFNVKEI